MKKFYLCSLWLLFLLTATGAYAQTTVSGTIKDKDGLIVPGASILVKGTVIGSTTGSDGSFTIKANQSPPVTLVVSFIGYKTQEIQVTDANTTNLEITLDEDATLLGDVTVTGSTLQGRKIDAATTIETIGLAEIQQAPAPDFFDRMAHVKGVQFTSSSLNFPQINTRGFATIANVRFVQFVDGMDISAPLLNFPTGNIVGLSELDVASMDLIPGASSALYGPNAFNGTLLMSSLSPFEKPGLSAQFKGGITTSDAQGESYPLFNFGVRYAKKLSDKFAFKINFSIMDAEDWRGSDYTTDVNNPESTINLSRRENFDGVNLYGDDTQIIVPASSLPSGLGPLDLRRTGWKEEDLIDDYTARSIKGDIGLHYRLSDNAELIYNYRYGGGSSVYQGSQKYALRDFTQQFHKLELKSSNYFVRAYMTETNAGDSYNMAALGGIVNERISPTRTQWAPTYAQAFVLAMQGLANPALIGPVAAGNREQSHLYARAVADQGRNGLSAQAIRDTIEAVRNDYFQRNPAGAKFIDNSRLWHGEFNYNFADKIKFAEIQIGGNVRRYSLFSDGTIFNEDPDDGTAFERVNIDEYGFYTQISKTIGKLSLTGSVRYDKNENFEGRVTPRISAIFSLVEDHFIRGSFQTGFRNPDTQAQFIYFPVGTNTLLGSARANAERYGVHEGGAWTRTSYEQFLQSGDSTDLVTDYVEYVKPEQLKSFEIGYKGLFGGKKNFLVDLNYYYTTYTDFIGGDDVAVKNATTHQGEPIPAGTIFSPYRNSPDDVTSYGIGLGLSYNTSSKIAFTANYNYATFDASTGAGGTFRAGFNTPENKYQLGVALNFGSSFAKNLAAGVNYRWQESFLWQSDFGDWIVPEFGVVDAQLSYKVASIKSVIKLGASNLFGGDYRTNLGGPFVGQQYYLSITFDELFR